MSSSHSKLVCQLCDLESHTAINCPYVYTNCRVPGCVRIMMLLKSERAMSYGMKYLKCQFPDCEGFKLLEDVLKESKMAKDGTSKPFYNGCFHCNEVDHRYMDCPWDGCVCDTKGCDGLMNVLTSGREISIGQKFLKCGTCGKFEWLVDAMAKKEGKFKARLRESGMSVQTLCNELSGMKFNVM